MEDRMLLLDEGPDLGIRDAYEWDVRKLTVLAWHELVRRLPMLFRSRPEKANPETRLAHMVMAVQRATYRDWSDDPTLLERLEAQLAVTNDIEVRKAFAKYLSEP